MSLNKKIKRGIGKLLFPFYKLVKEEEEIRLQKARTKFLRSAMKCEETTYISDDAKIQNSKGDPNFISVGKESAVYCHLTVFRHGGEISIGEYCYIGPGTRIWSAKKITIGNRVLIAYNVSIHDNISHPVDPVARHKEYVYIKTNREFQETNDLNEKEIIIEDDVWIGFNATILKGVRIGKCAIIGANTVITEDVPAGAIVVGNPARIIKYIDQSPL